MKLFILFSLFCGIFADDVQQEELELTEYTASHVYIPDCETYGLNVDEEQICTQCHEGFTVAEEGKKCTRNIPTTPYPNPITVVDGEIVHPEMGYDNVNGGCTTTIKIVDASGHEMTDKYSGAKSCLACAHYSSQANKCSICATGYLENNGDCTPLSIKPFGVQTTEDMISNDHCIYGKYENGEPKCFACKDPYVSSNNRCKLPEEITDSVLEGCIEKAFEKKLIDSTDVWVFNCNKCMEGYVLMNNVCKKSSFTTQYCMTTNEKGACTRCIPGYYMKASQCEKCTVKLPTDNYFTGDECNALGTNACDCNPNCIRDTKTYATCISRHCDLFSETEMSTVNSKNPKCLRCEQGYKLNADNECEPCTDEGCKSNDGKTCLPGYYLSEQGSCRKCEGKCIECISESICIEGKVDGYSPVAVNGLPCFDSNCGSCSATDPSICYSCKGSFKLIGGKCYQASDESSLMNAATVGFKACKYYKQQDFVTNENINVDYSAGYTRYAEIAYQRSYNEDPLTEEGATYYCQQYDTLPHYYRNYEDNKLTCAGKNRDPRRNCDCVPGYFATHVDKSTDCVKSTFKNCEIPLSNEICAKCNYSMVLVNDGVQKYPELRCGCPKSNQRINANGICVDCPEYCATCETVLGADGKFESVKCTKCRGEVESGDKSGLEEKNYNRDIDNQCKCLDGYVSFGKKEDTETGKDIVYSCYEIPSNCKNEGNYDIFEYEVTCNKCDNSGFSLPSCLSCDVGYYAVYDSDQNRDVIAECKRCPSFSESDTETTYCTDCSGGVCSTCISENMNATDSCRSCNEGYSMIFVDMDGVRTPQCVHCPYYCNMEAENSGCFFVNITELDEQTVDYFKNKFLNSVDYTEYEFGNRTQAICTHCYDNGSPISACECGKAQYQDRNGKCYSCQDVFEENKFTTIDASGNEIKKPYSEVCDLQPASTENSDPVCKANQLTYLPECSVCKDKKGRDPTYNCTKCTDSNTYAMYDGTNHICEKCLDKCTTCKNGNSCASCAASFAVGAQCDSCLVGYYKKDMTGKGDSANCVKCPEGCSECESATKCTVCSDDIRLLGPKFDCKACSTGYYFDILSNECVQVDVSKGFAESRAVCIKNNAEVNCETATEIDEVIEIPLRCDTSKGVGISPYPVNRRCVCDNGYLDNRTKADIEADPIPQCIDVRILAKDDFCVDAYFDEDGNIVCKGCNADYLELVNGKCTCKEGYYTTGWGMCVPCDRHIKGCTKCDNKTYCRDCDASAYKLGEEKEGKRECVGK